MHLPMLKSPPYSEPKTHQSTPIAVKPAIKFSCPRSFAPTRTSPIIVSVSQRKVVSVCKPLPRMASTTNLPVKTAVRIAEQVITVGEQAALSARVILESVTTAKMIMLSLSSARRSSSSAIILSTIVTRLSIRWPRAATKVRIPISNQPLLRLRLCLKIHRADISQALTSLSIQASFLSLSRCSIRSP